MEQKLKNITSEILLMSWYEHNKKLNEVSRFYPPEHPERISISKTIEDIVKKQKEIQNTV